MARRRRLDPLEERRRKHLIQGVGLAALVAVAAVMVMLALHHSG